MKTDFVRWASAPPSWIAGATGDLDGIVISSRLRVARNLAGVPFPHHSAGAGQRKVLASAFSALQDSPSIPTSSSLCLEDLNETERAFLVERHLISHRHARAGGEKGLVVTSGEMISIMINEEDHLRAASFKPGLDLAEAWETVSRLDDDLCARLPLAFNDEFGYLTACPTNLGTGLRASCLLHLPALVLTGQIGQLIDSLSDIGVVARGFYGEGTNALGDLFQISNGQTLGKSEAALIREVDKAVKGVAGWEKREGEALMAPEQRRRTEDRVFRSLGTLKEARLLNYPEAARLLSMVRLGLRLRFEVPVPPEKVTDLFFLAQPAHLAIRLSAERPKAPDEARRATFIQQRLGTGSGRS